MLRRRCLRSADPYGSDPKPDRAAGAQGLAACRKKSGFLRLCLGETMSAHDWRDGIGDFCVANYLRNSIRCIWSSTLHQSWIYGSYLLGAFGAPDVIDSGFRAQNPPITVRTKQHSRGELTLMLDLLVALRSEAGRYH